MIQTSMAIDEIIAALKQAGTIRLSIGELFGYSEGVAVTLKGSFSTLPHLSHGELQEIISMILLNGGSDAEIIVRQVNQERMHQQSAEPTTVGALQTTLREQELELVERAVLPIEIKDCIPLVIQAIRAGEAMGRGDKESSEELVFENGKFMYREYFHNYETFQPELTSQRELQESEAAQLIGEWLHVQDGILDSRGNAAQLARYAVRQLGYATVRMYLNTLRKQKA